jgi:hypothetical protein
MDLFKHLKDNLIEDESGKVYKGKFFRASVNGFMSADGTYTYQERMKPLKRMSCSGCADCGWIEDNLKEFININQAKEIIKNTPEEDLDEDN